MIIIIPVVLIGLLIYIYPKAKRFLKDDPVGKSKLLIMWSVTTILGLFCASVVREFYIVREEFSTSVFKMGGIFDVAVVWILFISLIFFSTLIFSFYSNSILERFLVITSIQLFFICSVYLFHLYNRNNLNSIDVYIWGSGIVISIIMFVINSRMNKVRTGKVLKDLLKNIFG